MEIIILARQILGEGSVYFFFSFFLFFLGGGSLKIYFMLDSCRLTSQYLFFNARDLPRNLKMAERLGTKSTVKLGMFRSQLEASCMSSHTEESWYNKTVYLWMTIYIVKSFSHATGL